MATSPFSGSFRLTTTQSSSYQPSNLFADMAAASGETFSDPSTVPPNSLLPDLPRAPELLFGNSAADKKLYWDRAYYDSLESQMRALEKSSTLYIGNMAFSTRSMQLRAHFAQVGAIKAVHMGLDKFRKTPCGFAFVEYYERRDALEAVASLSGTKLDGRVIRVELDAGFQPGREMGRGTSGGQVRDERRINEDSGRKRNAGAPPPSAFARKHKDSVQGSDAGHYGHAVAPMEGYADNSRFRDE
jgi:nuclear cap-binding protein subunit 2